MDYRVYWGYIGTMEKKMDATTVCWGFHLRCLRESGGMHLILTPMKCQYIAL